VCGCTTSTNWEQTSQIIDLDKRLSLLDNGDIERLGNHWFNLPDGTLTTSPTASRTSRPMPFFSSTGLPSYPKIGGGDCSSS
jgi:hypothetical protein